MRKVLLYAVFAGIATLVNLLAQMATVQIYAGKFSIPVSVLAGTIIGIAIKYLLDKHYIFRKAYSGAVRQLRSAGLYLLASVATTLIFWGAEAGFQIAFGTAQMRYVGGAIGLTIGYVIKYHLDKRFAFA